MDDMETIEGVGEVVRVEKEGPNTGMGVVFRELSGYSKEGFEGGAKAADQVLGEQLEHLKKLIDG